MIDPKFLPTDEQLSDFFYENIDQIVGDENFDASDAREVIDSIKLFVAESTERAIQLFKDGLQEINEPASGESQAEREANQSQDESG